MSKLLVASAAAALFAAVANAQSAPDWKLIPAKCSTDCAETVKTSFLCQEQYSIGTLVYGCFCESYPSDAANCATCLEANNAAALATLLKGTTDDCKVQEKACAFECAFETCPDSDVACQCNDGYLANIYNCASCNSANGNQGTVLENFQALNKSCGDQNYTGAAQAFNTWAPSPTAKDAYAAPTLTATGGGEAATGTFAAATDKASATDAGAGAAAPTATNTGATSAASSAAAASQTSAASSAASAAAKPSASAAGSAAPAASSKAGGAMALGVPAAAAVAGALVAVLL